MRFLSIGLMLLGVASAADVRPILQIHCLNCHSTKEQKGDLDLEASDIHQEPHVWENVLDQIELGEMPPKKEKPLSSEEKTQLVSWVRGTLDQIALANAGDPGPVVLRRLSNMEYTYTIRDLTGIDSLDPAREFPVDGAAGEGFTNAGAALVMSPALLTKYLDAAKDIANHAVFTPTGFHFSPSTSSQDWTDEMLAKIREFYARFTTSGNGTAVDLQGIKFDTNGGGLLPLEKYIEATRDSKAAVSLNAKYLHSLRTALESHKPSLILDIVRQQWRAGTPATDIATTITQWQRALWRFTTIGHIGKLNGPRAWQVPVLPLAASEELRFKPPVGRETVLHLVTHHLDAAAKVIWEKARLIAPGKPDRAVGIIGETVAIPADIDKDTEFVIDARLHPESQGAVQVRLLTSKPTTSALVASNVIINKPKKKGTWSDGEKAISYDAPILVADKSATHRRLVAEIAEFRALFPAALCYTKIVPVDEVVTLTLFHREDDHLKRLMLDDAQIGEIDRLWDELHFVSESRLKQVDVFEQLWQFATQDADPSAFEPLREPILKAAATFKEQQKAADAVQRQAVINFAAKAWRRPLSDKEIASLRTFSPRLMLARVLTSPAFLYRGEKAREKTSPVSDDELATRLSYFLWSSAPDEELRSANLQDTATLAAQARRMLTSDKVRRLATEFGCQYLHVRDVATLDEKSERHFPTFLSLRDDMQEEVTRFFIDLIQNNRSVLTLLDADYSFVNAELAKHYGFQVKGDDWQRVESMHDQGRGGILGFAATLAKQAGASRTSAILRGTWLSEVILGDKLPPPPKGVPVLPEEAPKDLSERQLIERHSRDSNCRGCHKRIDPFGFALEGFDAIGRARQADTKTTLFDGTAVDGLTGLRDYLLTTRRDDFLRQFSRKLLGYALGRSVQLSDKPLIDAMVKSDLRIGTLVALIVQSPQFKQVRGRDRVADAR
jgi:hypothetical protein